MMRLAATLCLLAGCASGAAIVTGTRRAPLSAGEVRLYSELPDGCEVIGVVGARGRSWTAQGGVDAATEELRRQAGLIGANGVVVTDGRAVFVPK